MTDAVRVTVMTLSLRMIVMTHWCDTGCKRDSYDTHCKGDKRCDTRCKSDSYGTHFEKDTGVTQAIIVTVMVYTARMIQL